MGARPVSCQAEDAPGVDSASSCPVFVAGELTASVVVAAVGLWGSRQRYPQIHSRAGGRSGSGGQRMIDDRSAFGIVVGEPARPPEDRQPAVRVFVDAHLGAHEVRTQRRRRDLQGEPLPFDGVVVADLTLFLDAENLPPGLCGISGN